MYKISVCNLLLIELYSKATCESEASATTNVLSARKQSVSYKCFICAKAKRQQQSSSRNENQPNVMVVS
ncbi:hypothetical protein [Lysinibacillus sp. G4S2]|uniref:hypothetical protein n=1 Tax=Lysinibacillus sp. G4S2 TaxID=3055859 RepID=UPI0025A0D640|nr:hypothetical protein [Lysinibacillus sp. G4S2]MDM5246715.1 hypothetical protein [Lysinibacillus sp. G4S2]